MSEQAIPWQVQQHAELQTALAAIKRVRELALQHIMCPDKYDMKCNFNASDVLAALEGESND
jgi:hypothetical protein